VKSESQVKCESYTDGVIPVAAWCDGHAYTVYAQIVLNWTIPSL